MNWLVFMIFIDYSLLQEDEHGEFQFLMSHIVSPDEVYVNPVTEVSGKMTELEEELARYAGS